MSKALHPVSFQAIFTSVFFQLELNAIHISIFQQASFMIQYWNYTMPHLPMAIPHERVSVAGPSQAAPHSLPAIHGRLLV